MSDPALDKFGQFVMQKLRDRGIGFMEGALRSEWKAPQLAELQAQLSCLPPEQVEVVRKAVAVSLDSAIHDFLFALGESRDFGFGIKVTCDDVDVVGISDGLEGEPYGGSGWIARFSAHP